MAATKPSEITDYIVALYESNKTSLGLFDVRYGDVRTIPGVPLVAVEPATLTRDLEGLPFQTLNTFSVSIIVYHTALRGVETIQREGDLATEAVAEVLDRDSLPQLHGGTNLGGLVTHGYVSQYEFGYRVATNELMRANRLIYTGITKTRLVP